MFSQLVRQGEPFPASLASSRVANGGGFCHDECVSTLVEVEQAAAKLAPEDQKQLLRFLLRILPMDESELPEPRIFSDQEIQGWLAEDEATMRRFRDGR